MWMLLACAEPASTASGTVTTPTSSTFIAFNDHVPQNVLILSLDTTRRDGMGRYADNAGDLPFLDELAQGGVALDNHRSCSNWTLPGLTCAITGANAIDLGFFPDIYYPSEAFLPPETPTLATRFAEHGWFTLMSTSNSWFSPDHGTELGFAAIERPAPETTTSVFDAAIRRLNSAPAAPWFAHLHVVEPHPPYDPPAEYLEGLDELEAIPYDLADVEEQFRALGDWSRMDEAARALLLSHLWLRYRGELRWMDDQIRDGFQRMTDAGLLDDTLVLIFNDHGEQFWEHGQHTHALGLNTEENDGIALFWARDIVPAAWTASTNHEDLAPTLLGLYGIEVSSPITGLPLGSAPADRALDFLALGNLGVVQAVVRDDWKLVYGWSDGSKELYDLSADPKEATNLYDITRPEAQTLWETLGPRVDALRPLVPRYSPREPGL